MNKFLNFLKIIIGWPISLLALFFIFSLIQRNGILVTSTLRELNLAVFAYSLICFLLYFLLRSFLWQQILKNKGYTLTLRETSFLWSFSEIKRYIPGNIWGILARAFAFSGKHIDNKTIFSSMIIETQLIVLAAIIISFFNLTFIFDLLIPNLNNKLAIVVLSDLVTILITIVFLGNVFFIKRRLLKIFFTGFDLKTNLYLLGIAILTFLLFGLGIYLSIASVVFLPHNYLILMISFFIFSLLAGYLSLVTPMGLGVREAVVILGLSKFMAVGLASLAAIFSRIVLVFSELIFISLSYLWLKSKKVQVFEAFLTKWKAETLLVLMILAYNVYFLSASLLRFGNFYTGRFDLGNMDQTIWNTIHGRLFQFTNPDGVNTISRLAFHADFVLVLLSPLYLIWSDPRMLLLIQTFIVSLGALFVFLITRKILNNHYAQLFSFLFLLNPSVQQVNLYDFHAVSLATTFLLGAFYFLQERKYKLFLTMALLAGLTKEDVWVIISLFGLWLLFIHKQKAGFLIFIFSLLLFYYLVWVAIPGAAGKNHFALNYYSDFGSSPNFIVKNILFSPQKTLKILLQPDRIEYLKQLLLPLGFVSLFSPLYFVFLLPNLLINLLSNLSQFRQISFQYASTITPFLFISSFYGVRFIKKVISHDKLLIIYLLTMGILGAYLYGPLPGARTPNTDMMVKTQPDKKVIASYLTNIPQNLSVAATNNLGAHLSQRVSIYTLPLGLEKADIIAFLLGDPFAQPSPLAQQNLVKKLKDNQNYQLLFEKGNFIVFKRKVPL